MACHMALGLLFLGGGSLTVGRQPLQLACLAMATWPRWPRHPGDHQHHLQPLRHLYVLAAEPRSLKALDADTGLPVFVPVTVTLDTSAQGSKQRPVLDKNIEGGTNGEIDGDNDDDHGMGDGATTKSSAVMTVPLVAPCLMAHDLSRVVKLEVNSPRYFSLCLMPKEFASHAAALQSLTLYVKRKQGCAALAEPVPFLDELLCEAADSSLLTLFAFLNLLFFEDPRYSYVTSLCFLSLFSSSSVFLQPPELRSGPSRATVRPFSNDSIVVDPNGNRSARSHCSSNRGSVIAIVGVGARIGRRTTGRRPSTSGVGTVFGRECYSYRRGRFGEEWTFGRERQGKASTGCNDKHVQECLNSCGRLIVH